LVNQHFYPFCPNNHALSTLPGVLPVTRTRIQLKYRQDGAHITIVAAPVYNPVAVSYPIAASLLGGYAGATARFPVKLAPTFGVPVVLVTGGTIKLFCHAYSMNVWLTLIGPLAMARLP